MSRIDVIAPLPIEEAPRLPSQTPAADGTLSLVTRTTLPGLVNRELLFRLEHKKFQRRKGVEKY